MLVQMLTERVANGGSYNLTFGESLTMAGIGMLVVIPGADHSGSYHHAGGQGRVFHCWKKR